MNNFATFHLFETEISKRMIERGTFNADWMNSDEGQSRVNQAYNEVALGISIESATSELELWCKGWVTRNRSEQTNPSRLATIITEH
jgi:hypothetical protein